METRTRRSTGRLGGTGRAGLALLGMLCGTIGPGGAVAGTPDPDPSGPRDATVRIRNWTVSPQTIRLDAGREIGWLNQTSRGVRVQFDRDVAREMVCRNGSGFRLKGDRLESPEIRASRFASLCSLSPGVYGYRVVFSGEGGGDGAPVGERALAGRVVVE